MATVVQTNSPTLKAQTSADAAAKIKPANQAVGPLKMVVYGRNGAGKTHFSGSSDLKTLIIDCDEQGFETVSDRPNVSVYEVSKWADLDGIFWHLRAGQHDFEVVVIDTITMLSTICLRHITGAEVTLDPLNLMPGGSSGAIYNRLGQILDNEIIRWRNLPMHVLFLAQERNITVRNEEGDDVLSMIGPNLTPHPLATLLGAVGTVGRIYSKEVEKDETTTIQHRMLLGPHPVYVAKSRIRGIPATVANPTLARLLARRAAVGEEPIRHPAEAASAGQ